MRHKQHLSPWFTNLLKVLVLLTLVILCVRCDNASSVWLYVDNQNDSALSVTVGGEILKEVQSGEHLITMVRPGDQVILMKLGATGELDSVRINLEEDKKYVLNPFRAMTYYLGKVEYSKYSSNSGLNGSEEEMIHQMIFPVDVDFLLEAPPTTVEVWGTNTYATRKYLRRETDPSPHGPSQEEMAAFIDDNRFLFEAELGAASGDDPSDGNDQANGADSGNPVLPTITEKQRKILQLIARDKLEEALELQFGKSTDFAHHQEALKAAETAYLTEPLKNYEAFSIAHSKVSIEILKSVTGIMPGTYDERRCLSLLKENKIEEATQLLIDAGYEMGAHQRLRFTQWRNEIEAGRIQEKSTLHMRNRIREAIKGSIEMGVMDY